MFLIDSYFLFNLNHLDKQIYQGVEENIVQSLHVK